MARVYGLQVTPRSVEGEPLSISFSSYIGCELVEGTLEQDGDKAVLMVTHKLWKTSYTEDMTIQTDPVKGYITLAGPQFELVTVEDNKKFEVWLNLRNISQSENTGKGLLGLLGRRKS